MPIPGSVKRLLKAQRVSYATTDTPDTIVDHPARYNQHLQQLSAATSVILEDQEGQLQALFSADCMLDLNKLNEALGRSLKAVSKQSLSELYERHQLDSLPALPKITGLPTVVDQNILSNDSITLESGGRDQLLQLDREQFKRILRDANTLDFAVPISGLTTYKPDDSEDAHDVQHAVENFTTKRIKQRLEETLEFPPLQETATQIIKLRVDPNADINDLSRIVEADPSLAAQVVSWAASPYYGAPGKIKSVHDAIVRVLGFDLVLNLALGLALGRTIKLPADRVQEITPFWQQAVYTSATIEGLVTAINPNDRPSFGLSYLSGLLHNFGYLVLAEVFPPHFSNICRYMEVNPHVSHHAIEEHLIGVSREQIAAWLMKMWNMPEEIYVGLRQQHNPDYKGDHAVYANLIYMTLRLLKDRGIGDGPMEDIPDDMYERLKLDPEKAELVVNHVIESADELEGLADSLGGKPQW